MSPRFPEHLPQEAGTPLPAAAEQAELLALAAELQRAHPAPELSADFQDRMLERAARRPGLHDVLRSSRLARAAATLLVVAVSVAPVLALVQILPWLRETKLVIQVERLLLPPRSAATREEPLPPLEAPQDAASTDPAWVESITRQNRMARAAASWLASGAASPPAAAPAAWESASAEDLWLEFVRRCRQGGSEPLTASLVARIEVLTVVGSADDRRLLAPWLWVLRGAAVPAEDGDPARTWSGAPWIAE